MYQIITDFDTEFRTFLEQLEDTYSDFGVNIHDSEEKIYKSILSFIKKLDNKKQIKSIEIMLDNGDERGFRLINDLSFSDLLLDSKYFYKFFSSDFFVIDLHFIYYFIHHCKDKNKLLKDIFENGNLDVFLVIT